MKTRIYAAPAVKGLIQELNIESRLIEKVLKQTGEKISNIG